MGSAFRFLVHVIWQSGGAEIGAPPRRKKKNRRVRAAAAALAADVTSDVSGGVSDTESAKAVQIEDAAEGSGATSPKVSTSLRPLCCDSVIVTCVEFWAYSLWRHYQQGDHTVCTMYGIVLL